MIINKFENDVKMYGIQASYVNGGEGGMFENDVKMYGIQALDDILDPFTEFENDVKMYGIQATLILYVNTFLV